MLIVLLMFAASLPGNAAPSSDSNDLAGWGPDDPYNRLFDHSAVEKIKGRVVGFKFERPLPDMSPATIMMINDGSGSIEVHICPTWFARPEDIGVRVGDRVKIRGCRVEIGGKSVIMAAKIKKRGFHEFKVRLTKNGKPFWTFSLEEVVREFSSAAAEGIER
jgi:hypothetical protein